MASSRFFADQDTGGFMKALQEGAYHGNTRKTVEGTQETHARQTYSKREKSEDNLVRLVGFQSKQLGREYTFTVRGSSTEPLEFTLTIANKAFNDHRVRYQDAPDICSLKLRHELATRASCPTGTHFDITDQDLEDYLSSHAPRSARGLYRRRPA